MKKKILFYLGTLLLLVTTLVSFVAIVKPTPLSRTASTTPAQQATIRVAVVNEDAGKVYNGQPVNIATTLVNSFIAQNNYDIEVVSRAIAENGLKNDTYQLMIVLPSKFSEETLALESASPIKANFQYQIVSDKQLTVKQAEQAVLEFKELFNKDLINIYFTSIIGNLRTAQVQVADVVANEETSLASFNNNLVNPLNLYSQQFAGVGSSPSDLLSAYSSFNKDLLSSNDAFTSIISVDKTYESVIGQIKSQQEAWQLSLATREQNLANFDEGFSSLSVEEQLAKLAEINTHLGTNLSEPAVWQETENKVIAYNQDIISLLEELRLLNGEIDTTLSDYDTKIKEAVAASLATKEGVVNNASKTLGGYIDSLNASMDRQVASKWPTVYYDAATIASLSLSEADKIHLKNINAFIQWYSQEKGQELPTSKEVTVEKEELTKLREEVASKIESARTLTIPTFEGKVESMTLTVPEGYSLSLADYPLTDLGNGNYQVSLPEDIAGGTKIPYSLNIQDKESVSIFSPVVVKMSIDTTEEVSVIKEGAPFNEEREETETTSTSGGSSDTTGTSTDGTGSEDEGSEGEGAEGEGTTQTGEKEVVTVTKTITITRTNQTETKVLRRHYEKQDIVTSWTYNPLILSQAIYQDVNAYLQLSGIVTAYYGLDLTNGTYSQSSILPAEGSLVALANSNDLQSIVTNLIKATTVEALKSDLKTSDEKLAAIESRLVNSEQLTGNIADLRATTGQLLEQLSSLIEQGVAVDKTLKDKPIFATTEKIDNTDMVTVSMDLNSDLSKLMAASQNLMNNTKSNQVVSEMIEGNINKLSGDITNLEKDGEALSGRVAELQQIMSREYSSNEEFLKNFSTVLSNTRTGNTKNEAVYEYLSNPVDAAKIGNVVSAATSAQPQASRQDERSGLLIILIAYLVSLVAAYLMQHADKAELQKRLNLTERLSWKNATGPLVFLSAISATAGLIIALVSGLKLEFSMPQIGSFIVLLSLISLVMTYGVNLLMDNLRSLGFLLSIGVLMVYIVSATQLFDTYYVNSTQLLARLSPLTYLEELVKGFINQQGNLLLSVVMLIILASVLGVGNMFLYRQVEHKE
ncbi:TPA: type VII secretion protein EsaA [Streptococcus suis]|nr:type VII secretion protein EsaA [Streptococcus suis]